MSDWPASHDPHSFIGTHNPVFDAEYRRMRWPRSKQEIGHYTLRLLVITCSLVVLAATIGSLLLKEAIIADLGISLVLANLAVTIAADLFYMLITIGKVSQEIVSGQWDELRLTSLDVQNIFQSKYAAILVRAWRMMVLQRIILVLSLVPFPIVAIINLILETSSFAAQEFFLLTVGGSLLGLTVWLVLYFEFEWQMRTITAIAFAISARIRYQTITVLVGFASLLAIRLLEVAVFLPTIGVAMVIANASSSAQFSDIGLLCVYASCFPFSVYFLRELHRRLHDGALKYALKSAFASE